MTVQIMFVHSTFSSVWVTDCRAHFEKELHIRLAVCSHFILSICNFSYFPFGFESGVWFFISPILVHPLHVTFNTVCSKIPKA